MLLLINIWKTFVMWSRQCRKKLSQAPARFSLQVYKPLKISDNLTVLWQGKFICCKMSCAATPQEFNIYELWMNELFNKSIQNIWKAIP